MDRCRNCFEIIKDMNFFLLVRKKRYLCASCYEKFHPRFRAFSIDDIKGRYIYDYDEIIREKLFMLKGGKDYEMAPVFLEYTAPLLRLLYSGFVIVPVPSFHLDDERRGFNHVEAVFSVLGKPFLKVLYKDKNVKQSAQNSEGRAGIRDVIKIREGQKLTGKKILLVDDVCTTGNSLKASLDLIKKHRPRLVEILTLSKTRK